MKLILRPYQQSILESIYQSFLDGNRRPLVTAPCGSGKTVIFTELARLTQAKGNRVVVLVHRRELLKQTLNTFQTANVNLDLIEVHMAQTYSRHLGEHQQPDLIVTDECHMAAAKTWQRIYDHWPDAYVVGFSASPCRLDNKPLGAIFDDLITSVSTRGLIEDGWLAPYRYYGINVADLSGIKMRGRDYDPDDAKARLDSGTVYGDVIAAYRKYADGARTVVYCINVEHSKETAAQFSAAGYRAEHNDGTFTDKKRDKIIERFRSGDIQILTNCDIVSTGFDLPAIGCCIMLRPTMSTSLYIQQSGRALRREEGKVAVIIDAVANHVRHGLPDDDKEWSLDKPVSPKRHINEDGSYSIRLCKSCYAVYESTKNVCPVCNAEYEYEPREIKHMEEVELIEIQKKREEKEKQYAMTDKAITDAKSYSDLCKIAKLRGYKTGWAYHQAKQKGIWVPY